MAVEVVEAVDGGAGPAVRALVAAAGAGGDAPPLDDRQVLGLSSPALGLLALSDGRLVGYAQLLEGWHLGLVATDPSAVGPLLRRALSAVRERGGGTVEIWDAAGRDPELGAAGFVPGRRLLQLRAALPLGAVADPDRRRAAAAPLRPFRVGADEGAWLAVNARAFAGHPDQGAWSAADLAERQRQGWFDPDGFVVLDEGGHMVGSCWTKVHRSTTPPMGEIYVIAVDPSAQGRGLGRLLAVAGLDHLAAGGLHVAMLYVDPTNESALGLYRGLGFVAHHEQRAWRRSVPERPPDPEGDRRGEG